MDEGVKIGQATYFGPFARDPEFQRLVTVWQTFGYGKFSGPDHIAEWAVVEAILEESEIQIRYVGSSGIDYLSMPLDKKALAIFVDGVQRARVILSGFVPPERAATESRRSFIARWADLLERHLCSGLPAVQADLAADRFASKYVCAPE